MSRFIGILAGLAIAAAAIAQDVPPDVQVKNVTNEVLEIVRKDKDIQSGNTRKAMELVETKVQPHFDFQRMTASAVGKHWRQATPEQRAALVEQFRTLLVRTYANALTAYRNQSVDFKPFKMAPTDTDVTVRTEIRQPGAKPIPIDYALTKGPSGWLVYDFSISGVDMVLNYRSQFSQEIANGGGIDGLIKSLQAKNAAPNGSAARK